MNTDYFNSVIEYQIERCKEILIDKAKEYATEDRLHNFKCAAGMQECDPKEALAGMMAKHTISVYDMCRDKKVHPLSLWEEKITDHINYLLLLKAVVTEECVKSAKKTVEETAEPTIEDALSETDKEIYQLRKQIIRCASAECDECAYHEAGRFCENGFLEQFDDLVIKIKEEAANR